ncbi:MAG: hypothetical protein PUP92_38645, partial [Rhizonema sp. PD38]|nr:hypothetical protein [Rhizonema sp. PD38]
MPIYLRLGIYLELFSHVVSNSARHGFDEQALCLNSISHESQVQFAKHEQLGAMSAIALSS